MAAPSNITDPSISGTLRVGETLTGDPGTWSNDPTSYTYEWFRSATPFDSFSWVFLSNLTTYTLTSSEEGNYIILSVTAENADGSSSMFDLVGPVAAENLSPPSATANPEFTWNTSTSAFDATTGEWEPAGDAFTYAYQWQLSADESTWSDISGATSSSYAPVSGDAGNYLRVEVTATNTNGSTSANSWSIGPLVASAAAPTTSDTLTISGTATVGETLSADSVSWSGSPTPVVAYRWEYWEAGEEYWEWLAFGQTLTLISDYVGLEIRAVSVATNYADVAQVASSSVFPEAAEADFTITTPTLSGTTTVGSTLTASVSATGGATAVSFSYFWLYSDDGTSWDSIADPTSSSTWTLTNSELNRYIKVEVTATNSSGSRVDTSEPVGPITAGSSSSSSLSIPTFGLIFWKRFCGS